MGTYADLIREVADLLDKDVKANRWTAIGKLLEICAGLCKDGEK